MRDRFNNFMRGRYGSDQLAHGTLVVSLILVVLSAFLSRFGVLSLLLDTIGLAGIVVTYFRMLSRDISSRSAENQKYIQFTQKIRRRFSREKYYMDQRKTNHIYSCPSCGQKIRIPKGKGKIEIDCPKCHNKFIKRS